MSKKDRLRYALAAPFVCIAFIIYLVYALVGALACIIGGKKTTGLIVKITESATR